jgi:hypothetical protein
MIAVLILGFGIIFAKDKVLNKVMWSKMELFLDIN